MNWLVSMAITASMLHGGFLQIKLVRKRFTRVGYDNVRSVLINVLQQYWEKRLTHVT